MRSSAETLPRAVASNSSEGALLICSSAALTASVPLEIVVMDVQRNVIMSSWAENCH